jgi:murein DD-endopeptidase MepM/ murein hydrolase activator NlpD
MFRWSRKISIIVAPHGSSQSWNRDVSLPVLVGVGAGLIALVLALMVALLQVAELSARTRELARLREENAEVRDKAKRVRELEADLARLQEFETRIRRWAGIEDALAASPEPAGESRWEREDAQLAAIPSLAPIEGWVSRGFVRGEEGHEGIDFVGQTGTPVLASALGTVQFAGWDDTFGNLVILDHGNGFTTFYGHNDSILVALGDVVLRGETVAKLGNTGRSSAPHVHFEIRLNDEPLDPAFLLSENS